ncbi:MAG: MBL fold metallo-hydrolase [Spirochaetaceae bacterium]|nr:MAG: MBL fold metallo-hydrolase [Spirochaetaceae bacterium]
MKMKFWGVRGSIPTPLSPEQLRRKISAVVHRITPKDIESPQARERFMARCPESLFGTIGGNTACLELVTDNGQRLIIDAGTGIRELGLSIAKRRVKPDIYDILMTHFHWDHIQGLPFFIPLLKKGNTVRFYSPVPEFEKYLSEQMRSPFFPITLDMAASSKEFIGIPDGLFSIREFEIRWKKMQHPGGSVSYKCTAGNKGVIFATDTEIGQEEFSHTGENELFFRDTDILIIDAQYTLREYIDKTNWGHTSQNMAVDLAIAWNIKHLYFFHHEPIYTDNEIYRMRKSAEWYNQYLGRQLVEIHIAREGQEIVV